MRIKADDEYNIPVINCPNCERRDVVLYVGLFTNTEGGLERIWYCPGCSYVPVFDEEIKGYISLTEMGEYEENN